MADASAAPRGKLKVFFGAFPGAGKTDAMLDAARRIRDAGRDVVIGVLDMHGKPEEAAANVAYLRQMMAQKGPATATTLKKTIRARPVEGIEPVEESGT